VRLFCVIVHTASAGTIRPEITTVLMPNRGIDQALFKQSSIDQASIISRIIINHYLSRVASARAAHGVVRGQDSAA